MNKEEVMLPVLLMGLVGFSILTIISLLLFLSRLYVYYKYKNNFTSTKVITKEKKESKQENIEKEIKASRKERSGYYYSGKGKLFPDDKDFIENNSWPSDVLEFYFKDKKNRIKRSDYFYKGSDKLKPTDKLFFENNSWKVVEEQKNREELSLGNFKESFLN